MSELFNLFIRNLRIDWSEIGERSYLRDIPGGSEPDRDGLYKEHYLFCGGERDRKIHSAGGGSSGVWI